MSHLSHPSPKLRVFVIGGGLGGLATAFAIARTENPNISVTVLERHFTLSEAGAGITVGANAARVIYKWGLQKPFEAISTFPTATEFRRYDSGKVIGNIWNNYRDFSEHMYGYPQGNVHRADLQQMLAKAAIDVGVNIQLDKRVDRIECDSETPEIILRDGTSIKADLVIGADGVWSKTRSSIPENKDIKPVDGHMYTYRFLVPKEKMLSRPETAALIQDAQHRIFLLYAGPKQGLVGYPVGKEGNLYNVVLQISEQSDAPSAGYTEPGDIDEMRELYSSFDETVRTLLQHPDSSAKWSLVTTPSLPAWSSSNGRVILMGDAAHAMVRPASFPPSRHHLANPPRSSSPGPPRAVAPLSKTRQPSASSSRPTVPPPTSR